MFLISCNSTTVLAFWLIIGINYLTVGLDVSHMLVDLFINYNYMANQKSDQEGVE